MIDQLYLHSKYMLGGVKKKELQAAFFDMMVFLTWIEKDGSHASLRAAAYREELEKIYPFLIPLWEISKEFLKNADKETEVEIPSNIIPFPLHKRGTK